MIIRVGLADNSNNCEHYGTDEVEYLISFVMTELLTLCASCAWRQPWRNDWKASPVCPQQAEVHEIGKVVVKGVLTLERFGIALFPSLCHANGDF